MVTQSPLPPYTQHEAARLLNLSVVQVWALVRSGALRGLIVSARTLRIARADVDRWCGKDLTLGVNETEKSII